MTTAPATTGQARLAAFASALDDCHERAVPGGAVASRTGWTVASAERLADGSPVPGAAGLLTARRNAATADARALDVFCAALLRLHWQTLRDALDTAVGRLDERESEGTSLLGRQLVRGAVADVALALSGTRDLLDLPAQTPERRHRAHRDLVAAGRTALRLHGAHGFTADGAGTLLHMTELLGNTYLHAEAAHD
ncbi:hypothetical protein AB0I77_11560 [Streptomyces sp. NPDC050619]|uniref:hypothetical protein n=1 Tax=Streptomyces sp. NPDC050619 TaxID=3157214 RepID=UPI00341F4ABC